MQKSDLEKIVWKAHLAKTEHNKQTKKILEIISLVVYIYKIVKMVLQDKFRKEPKYKHVYLTYRCQSVTVYYFDVKEATLITAIKVPYRACKTTST